MAKLTIEIEEIEFGLYDVTARLNGDVILEGGGYSSEWAALTEARYRAWTLGRKLDD